MINTPKPKYTFEQRYAEIGEELKTYFASLELAQKTFINYCKYNGRLLFIENHRFTDEEQGYSDEYKIVTALQKVLATQYQDDMSFISNPGTTETFHAVIALPKDCEEIITQINETKKHIGELLSKTVDSRTKVEGTWQPMNKEILRTIGRPRTNIKQVRRRLNVHQQQYKRISYSGTWQRPVYRKSFEEIKTLLWQFTSHQAKQDRGTLDEYRHLKEFALYYDKYYSSMDGNFKLITPVQLTKDDGSEHKKSIFTQKISSPIYLLCDEDVNDVDVIVKYKMKEKKNARSSSQVVISDKPILNALPVYTYELND